MADTNEGTGLGSALAAIHEASQQLLRLQDPEALATEIIGILERLLTYQHLAVLLIHPRSRLLVPFAISDQGEGEAFREHDKSYIEAAGIKLGQGVTGWVAKHGESVRIADVGADKRYLALRDAIGSELCVPLILDDRVIGAINVETCDRDAYSEADQLVLETIASQIAIAIENSRLFAEAREARRNTAIAEQAGEIIHDLGNLLSVIHVDVTQCLESRADRRIAREVLERIRAAAEEGAGLANRILHAARSEHPLEISAGGSDLGDVVRANQGLISAIAGRDIKVRTRVSDSPLQVDLAQSVLEQVLLNLVVNACQSMPAGGELIVEAGAGVAAGKEGALGMLRVTDTGTGMSESVRENAFHPYFSTREQGGGLGLAIVARLVAAGGGRAMIDSAPDCGTAVTVHLPIG